MLLELNDEAGSELDTLEVTGIFGYPDVEVVNPEVRCLLEEDRFTGNLLELERTNVPEGLSGGSGDDVARGREPLEVTEVPNSLLEVTMPLKERADRAADAVVKDVAKSEVGKLRLELKLPGN
jgi:hypothetical protein